MNSRFKQRTFALLKRSVVRADIDLVVECGALGTRFAVTPPMTARAPATPLACQKPATPATGPKGFPPTGKAEVVVDDALPGDAFRLAVSP